MALLISTSAGILGCSDVFTRSRGSRESGTSLYEQGSYELAAGAFADATRKNPRDYQSFYQLGECYRRLEQEQKAIHAYRRGLDATQSTFDGQRDLAFRNRTIETLAGYIATVGSREAEVQRLELAAQSPGRALDWVLLARTYAAMGDADNAIDAYNRASLLSPEDRFIARSYGLYLEQLGQSRRAEPHLVRAYQLDPTDVEVAKALRRVGVVPGPSLLAQTDLARPVVPQGPIPEMKLSGDARSAGE